MNAKKVWVTLGTLVAVYIVAFLISYVWEMAQMPFFSDMNYSDPKTWSRCLVASIGDANIIALIFLLGVLIFRSWGWPKRLNTRRLIFLGLSGALVAISFELFALATDRWSYSSLMPMMLGVGLVPLVQLLILPYLAYMIALGISSRLACSPD